MNTPLRRPLSSAQSELMDKMTAEIAKPEIKTVSFKADDTLISLPFAETYDIFALMEQDFQGMIKKDRRFADVRTDAEDTAEKKLSMSGQMTIAAVYDVLMKQCGITEEQRDFLMNRECELYEQYVMPRRSGKLLFDKAVSGGKKIIVTYMGLYPREMMKRVLEKCGFREYNILILHNELQIPASAETGFLDIVIKKAKKATSVLHIGCDVQNDVEAPILRSAKALLLQSAVPLSIKSGRFRGYLQGEYIYDYDTDGFFALRCLWGLYRSYGFDTPQKKTVHSDFCSDPYMMGFLILGGLSLAGDIGLSPMQTALKNALEKCPQALDGLADIEMMFDEHFGGLKDSLGRKGCELPLVFLEKYAYSGDKEILKPYLSEQDFASWAETPEEPELAPVYAHKAKKNAVARLADRLFPPGTRVRTIADDILAKGKKL
ncbi:MAG: hypothetical protein IJ779_10095 [Ruminococcus sp.]|nr:hypothetical protein [Ruminococcus sp.]